MAALDEAAEAREAERRLGRRVRFAAFSASSFAWIALCGTANNRRVNASRAAALPLISLAGMEVRPLMLSARRAYGFVCSKSSIRARFNWSAILLKKRGPSWSFGYFTVGGYWLRREAIQGSRKTADQAYSPSAIEGAMGK